MNTILKLVLTITVFTYCLSSFASELIPQSKTKSYKTLTMSTVRKAVVQEISILVLREAYYKIGYELKVAKNPGLRSLVESNQGRYDGEISRVYNTDKSYKNLVRVNVPINVITGVAFVREDSDFKPAGWESLRGKRLGIHRGTVFSMNGTKGFPNLTIVGKHTALFKMLSQKKVDIAVCPLMLGQDLVNDLGLKGIKPVFPALGEYKLYHFLHKKNQELVPRLEEELKKMEASGRIAEIRKEFLTTLNR